VHQKKSTPSIGEREQDTHKLCPVEPYAPAAIPGSVRELLELKGVGQTPGKQNEDGHEDECAFRTHSQVEPGWIEQRPVVRAAHPSSVDEERE
jgi:hypothetical protein